MKLTYLAAIVACSPLFRYAPRRNRSRRSRPMPMRKRSSKRSAADKAKLKIYCEMAALSEQIDAAEQKKDTKTADALAQKIDSMAEQLGPAYILLMDGLQDMDENSKEAEAIGKTLEGLDEMCGK